MDQTLFNWVVGVCGFLGGWVLKVIWDAIKDLKTDIRQIERDLPEVYVRKDDFKEAIRDIKQDMKDGFNKIDSTLKRIEDGSYGYCVDTGDEIGLERMEARLTAERTLDAQERWEHLQKQMGD